MERNILQLFAEAGSVVNTTTGTANSVTGATETTGAMSAELKSFYDTELLDNARVEMFYAQFAKRQALPANHGTTVEWRKWIFNTGNNDCQTQHPDNFRQLRHTIKTRN